MYAFMCLSLQVCLIGLTIGESSMAINNNGTAQLSNDLPQLLYKLNLTDAAATYTRLETGTLEAGPNGKQLRIAGTFHLKFPHMNTESRVSYTADKRGYRASYTIGTIIPMNISLAPMNITVLPPNITLFPFNITLIPFNVRVHLSVSSLKSAAG